MKKIITSTLLCLSLTTATGQTPLPPVSEQPSLAAFKAIAGRWKSQATFESRTSDARYATNGTSSWSGLLYGAIKPNGQMTFKAANGCMMTGFADPFASTDLWAFQLEVEGCSVGHFNGTLFGNVKRHGAWLQLEVKDAPFAIGKIPVAHSIKAMMAGY